MRKGLWRIAAPVALAGIMAGAQPASEDIRGVIASQLDAFRASDLPQAFTFASPTIKELFDNPTRFGLMVQQGYPMVWAPGPEKFLGLQPTPRGLEQTVMIPDADGRLHILRYEMVLSAEGIWQINGVRIVDPGDVGL